MGRIRARHRRPQRRTTAETGRLCDAVPALTLRIVLAEDNYLVREGVRRLLETQADLEVVATCDDLDSLLGAVEVERPDVVLTDIRMPPGEGDEGIQAAARLRETHPEIGVVVLTQFSAPEYALALLEQGTEGRAYLLKERVDDLEQLAGANREVAVGGSAIDSKVVESLMASRSRRNDSPLDELTPREHRADGRDGERQEQRGDSGVARDHGAVGREVHPLDLPETGPRLAARRASAREGRAIFLSEQRR